VTILQQNNYPWDGQLKFSVSPQSPATFALRIRIPGWARNEAIPSDLYTFSGHSDLKPVLKINGQPVDYSMDLGYAVISRNWKKNDQVELVLPMEVRRVKANTLLKDDIGKVALQRGPIIYCAEWADNNGKAGNILVPGDAVFSAVYKPEILEGVTVLQSELPVVQIDEKGQNISTKKMTVTAIPYYAWANRGKGEMVIWFPEQVTDVDLLAGDAAGINIHEK